jgi:hypothetical protein
MASSNTPTITRVPAGPIVDEIVANSGRSSFDFTSSSSSDDIGHDDEVVVVDTAVDPDDGNNSGISIEGATLDDVLLCPLGKSNYPFMNYNKRKYKDAPPSDKTSKVVSIKGKAPINISAVELAKFMQSNNLKQRKITKQQMIRNLVIATEAWQTARVVGNDPVAAVQLTEAFDSTKVSADNSTKEPAVIWSRLINCLFLVEDVKQLLPTRGKVLSKEELTAGKKTGQDFFESLRIAYNDDTNIDLDILHHEVNLGKDAAPHSFGKITSWMKMKEQFNKMMRVYEDFLADVKKSGTNDDGEEIPIEEFTRKYPSTIIYLHYFAKSIPDFLERTTGALPDNVKGDANKGAMSLFRPTPSKVARLKAKEVDLKETNTRSNQKKNLRIERSLVAKELFHNQVLLNATRGRMRDIMKDEFKTRTLHHRQRREARVEAGMDPVDEQSVEDYAPELDSIDYATWKIKDLIQNLTKMDKQLNRMEEVIEKANDTSKKRKPIGEVVDLSDEE